MFSDELVVTVLRRDGTEESYFVPAEHVERERRRVRVAFHDTGSVMWATLPTPDSVTIPVSKAHVEPLDEWPEEFLACLGSLDEDIPRYQQPVREPSDLHGDPELQATLEQRMAGDGPYVSLEEAEAMVGTKARAERMRYTPLAERVGPIVEAYAQELPAVRRAYVRNDGAEFLLLGDGALPEMAESAARLSLALQYAFAPDYATYIDGGYEAVMDRPVSDYTLVFERM